MRNLPRSSECGLKLVKTFKCKDPWTCESFSVIMMVFFNNLNFKTQLVSTDYPLQGIFFFKRQVTFHKMLESVLEYDIKLPNKVWHSVKL